VALLKRGRCSGRVLEVVIGHCTFAALVNHMTLNVFHRVYRFIQSCYWSPAPFWRSVSDELVTFLGVMWFLQSDWTLPWNPYVCAADSSTTGFGISHSLWPVDAVKSVRRVRERSRFWHVGAVGARESALQTAGFAFNAESERWGVAEEEQLGDWDTDDNFPEVPA
jgi:hypothetical protein